MQHVLSEPVFEVTSEVYHSANGSNRTLIYDVTAHRQLRISSQISLANGITSASWSQQLNYSNSGNYTSAGDQTNTLHSTGQDLSSSGYQRSFDYPLYSHSTQTVVAGNLTLTANVSRGKSVQTQGQAVFPTGLESFCNTLALHSEQDSYYGARLYTSQNGTAYYTANQTEHTSYSYGTTEQDMSFQGLRSVAPIQADSAAKSTRVRELFRRHVKAVNDSVVEDEENLLDAGIGHGHDGPENDGTGMAVSGSPGKGAARWKTLGTGVVRA